MRLYNCSYSYLKHTHYPTLNCTWFLFETCENAWLKAHAASVPPAPESPSVFVLQNEPARRSLRPPASVRKDRGTARTQWSSWSSTCGVEGLCSLTWSLNMSDIISKTCILHCCSLWADARNFTRSSKPLMWMAHSSLSWMLASSSTFYTRGTLWKKHRWEKWKRQP